MRQPRSIDTAWERICDTFLPDQPFSMQEAVITGFPGVTPNNYSFYAKRLRSLFDSIKQWTQENLEGPPHIMCVSGHGLSPTQEVWLLPSSKEVGNEC